MNHEETEIQRRQQLDKAIEFAGRYVRSFDPELLNHWYKTVVERTLPASASHAELAADNALRAFVVGIVRQYQFALTGEMDKPWLKIQAPPEQKAKTRVSKRRKTTSKR